MPRTVTVVGGGVAGLSAACALAEAGLSVHLLERRPFLGGRASSYRHPAVGEVIDNCQHVLFGCCTNLAGFYRRIGAAGRIRWSDEITLVEPGGRRSVLRPAALPPPLHRLPSFLAARAFSARDKLALARAFAALLRPVPADASESFASWLARHGQTPGALERFWRLVIASALNADLDSIGLPYAAKVARELFLTTAEGGRLGLSTVPLGELAGAAEEFLRRRGGAARLNTGAEAAAWDSQASQWEVETPGGAIRSDFLVLALSFEAMAKLVPRLPPAAGADPLARQLARHEHGPICSVHLWFDREITALDHAALLDREIHWMFNRSRLQPWRQGAGGYLELVVSAARAFAALPGEEAIARSVRELAEFFPAVRSARLVKAVRIKEVHATFAVPPGIDASRAASASPWPNCFLAGDWTATGWPSTMESAARSGHLAAEALCRTAGEPRTFLDPDLGPRGLMRLFGRRAAPKVTQT
jgi:zeta-carotene desaturase